ncbi:MAG TPA: hypothetical protein VGH27_30190 [Streptosporangiaceae bacterium]|jgi:hypothetical protein
MRGKGLPRTCVGQWLRAVLLRQQERGNALRLKLNGGHSTGWNEDEPAVAQAASELLLRQFFGSEYDVRAVTQFAGQLREATAGDNAISQLKAEAVIRSDLGESDVATSDIKRGEEFRIRMAAMALVTRRLETDAATLDPVLVDAERLAFERGWHPPLADG